MSSKSPSILLAASVYVGASLLLQVLGRQLGTGAVGMPALAVVGCLLMVALGALPVWHYAGRHRLTVGVGAGAGMGALAIALGAIVMAAITWMMVEAGLAPDPQAVAADQADAMEMTPQEAKAIILMAHPLLTGLIGALLGAIVGAIGGAIGASVFKKGEEGPPDTIDPYGP